MSAIEVMTEIEKLPAKEQEEVFAFLTRKLVAQRNADATSSLGKKLSFEDACNVVFCENRELLALLAK